MPVHRNNTVNAALTSAAVRLESGQMLQLEIHTSLQHLRDDIETLRRGPYRTIFNSPAWLENYIATHDRDETPCLIAARDRNGDVAFFWPMSVHRRFATRVLGWLGQSVFAVNIGCYREDVASQLTQTDLRRIFQTLRESGLPFDAVHLLNQPETWNNVRNPMMALDQQVAPNGNFERPLQTDYATLYDETFSSRERRNHARQRRRLAEHGEIKVSIASTAQEQNEILNTFYAFKTAQLDTIGASNPFRSEAVKTFYRSALASIEKDGSTAVFCRLSVDETLVATLIGVRDGNRFTTLMSAITLDPIAKASPGQQLLEYLVRNLCENGVEVFDFGPGASIQKRRWEMAAQPLYNSYHVLTSRARPATWIASGSMRIMQEIKNNDRAFRFLTQVRARMAGK